MNYLEMCRRVRQEAGLSGTGPGSVVSATGEERRIVDWTQQAYIDVQNMQAGGWNWMWRPADELTLEVGRDTYDAQVDFGALAVTWREMRIDGVEIQIVPWNYFRRAYPAPRHDGTPVCASIRPDRKIVFSHVPTLAHAFSGEYLSTPESLTENEHTPTMPEQYHMAIVWRAVEYAAQFEEAPALIQSARDNFNRLYAMMLITELPEVEMAGPLA